MFAVKDGILYLASENVSYSHAKWFELKGWMNSNDDQIMNEIIRGFVDKDGVYFYKGYDFKVDSKSEKEFFQHLQKLIK